ncbi:solute carrier family 15 member 1 isoform X2 [Lingula anatina]|uniref:Solute carrier family 15 member 1 isoform X2 n=1 Tax=Lingula anatina TaxID=7574 RepID=A0A1S3I0X6_LINAN|nr:solute carrier family 15 member 1 isoform X2 [Lingula anatina]XP_013391915.1 solute carrier family 15 member 1 isoform X2 [Lingula anatina]|eukprot:XP_013391914.1 solute carrier family 15 member 1 isoform X2 [Lingula anatina]
MLTPEESDDETVFGLSDGLEATNLLNKECKTEDNMSKNSKMKKIKKLLCKSEDYPTSIFYIVTMEFCERFSYYGMKTILVIYLTKKLLFDENSATALYHIFSMLCYFTPLFGAMLADGYLGKFKTILYLSIVYGIGNLIMSLTALPPPESIGPSVGLLLIGIGTGGIKPCVSSFGGDQFLANQAHLVASYFSLFYFAINAGSLISTFITPVLRADVHCLGANDCYLLAFGMPAALMIVALLVFVCGKSSYKINPPTGNLLGKVFKCIGRAIKNKFSRQNKFEMRDHWLDYADDVYENSFIEDVKAALHVLFMFLPLPIFWSLFDQQGSRWTLQAEKMDGQIVGSWILKPDQMQVINPVLIILLIPFFETLVYPCLDKCKIPNRPLQRMCMGMLLAGCAFIIAGFVQIKIDSTIEPPLDQGQSKLSYINALSCPVNISSSFYNGTLDYTQGAGPIKIKSGNYSVKFSASCASPQEVQFPLNLQSQKGYETVIANNGGQLQASQLDDHLDKPKKGQALISCIYALPSSSSNITLHLHEIDSSQKKYSLPLHPFESSGYFLMEPGGYTMMLVYPSSNESKLIPEKLDAKMGGVYSLVLQPKKGGAEQELELTEYIDVAPNSVPMYYQIPQYVVITAGEILFSITGLSFAYSQAPASMKSVLQAGWLLTVSFGNLIVVIVAESRLLPQAPEFFLFAALMGLDTLIFGIMACFYKYVTPKHADEIEDDTAGLVEDEIDDRHEDIPLNGRLTNTKSYTDQGEGQSNEKQ